MQLAEVVAASGLVDRPQALWSGPRLCGRASDFASKRRIGCFEFCRGASRNPVAQILTAFGAILYDLDGEGRPHQKSQNCLLVRFLEEPVPAQAPQQLPCQQKLQHQQLQHQQLQHEQDATPRLTEQVPWRQSLNGGMDAFPSPAFGVEEC